MKKDTDKSVLNLVILNQIFLFIKFFRLIWYETEFCLEPNQSEENYYNPNLVRFNKIHKEVK